MLFALLLCVGAAIAQVQEGKAYYLKVAGVEGYIDAKTGHNDTSGPTVAVSADPVKVYFKASTDGKWKISVNEDLDGGFLKVSKWCANPNSTEDGQTDWSFVAVEGETDLYYVSQEYYQGNSDPNRTYLGNSSSVAVGTKLFTDQAVANAVKVQFVEATQPTTTVTYTFTYNGNAIGYTQQGTVLVGADFPEITVALPMGVVATKPAGIVSEENANQTIEVSIDNSKLPFVAAENYESIEHWYYMNIRDDSPTYAYYDASISYIKADKSAVDKKDKDVYSWAFIGNPIDGFCIVNKAAGETMVLSSPVAPSKDADLEQVVRMVTKADATGNLVWSIMNPTHADAAAGAFYVQHPTEKNWALNRQDINSSKALCYWNSRDTGSALQVVERPMGPVAELESLVEEAEALQTTVNENIGTVIGEYSQETADALATAVTTANAVVEAENATTDDVEALQAAMDAVKIILPTVGRYYQIHSSLAAFAETKAVYSDGSNPAWASLNEDDKKFYWEAVATANGGVALKNANDGKYMTGGTNPWTMAAEITAAAELDVKIFATTAHEKGYEYGVILSGSQMHANSHGGGTGVSGSVIPYNTNNANSASSWYIVEEELPEFYTVTYNFKYNEEVKYTQSVALKSGAAYPAMSVLLPYGVTSNFVLPEGTVSADAEYNFTLTVESELPFEAAADVANINTWYYVQMHTNQPGYIGDIADDKSINVAWNKESDESDNFVWGFAGNVFDGITVVNKGTGLQLTSTGGGNVTLTEAGTAFFVATSSETTENATYGFCLRKKDSNQFVNANYTAAKLSHWTSTDAGSTFFVTECDKEYTVEVATTGYATYYSLYRLAIPETVKAYVVSETNEGAAKLEQVTGVLPARTGVILEGEGTHAFVTTDAAATAIASNKLQGSIAAKEVTVDENKAAYILADGSKGVGLYKVALTDGKFANGANKAYMILDKEVAAEAAMFSFERGEGTTSIEQVAADAELVIYDLAGRRVEKMEKGIYIVNGKKVIK